MAPIPCWTRAGSMLSGLALAAAIGALGRPVAVWATATGPMNAPAGGNTAEERAVEPASVKARMILENDRVRAHILIYPPGSSTPQHEHLHPRVAVGLAGGRLLVQAADGAVRSVVVKPGDVLWLLPERHRITNPGPDEVRLAEIEVLDCPRLTK